MYVLLCLNRVIVAVTMSVLMIIQPAVFAFLSFRKQLWVCPSNILRHGFIQDLSFGVEVPSGRRPRAFLRDPGGYAPPEMFSNEYALRCNLLHFETVLRNVTVVFYFIF